MQAHGRMQLPWQHSDVELPLMPLRLSITHTPPSLKLAMLQDWHKVGQLDPETCDAILWRSHQPQRHSFVDADPESTAENSEKH